MRVYFIKYLRRNQHASGSELILDADTSEKMEAAKGQIDSLLKSHFRPEFLNRIDEIVMFQRLDKSCIGGIVRIQLERVAKRLIDRRITIKFDDSAVDFISEKGYDPAFGKPLFSVFSY